MKKVKKEIPQNVLDTQKRLYENITFLVKQCEKKPGEIEENLNLSKGYFSRLKDRLPDLQNLIKISNFFEIDYNSLFTMYLGHQSVYDEKSVSAFISYLIKITTDPTFFLSWKPSRFEVVKIPGGRPSPGMHAGFYPADYIEMYERTDDSYDTYTCEILNKSICICIIDLEEYGEFYEITIDNELLYASILDTDSKTIHKQIDTLVWQIKEQKEITTYLSQKENKDLSDLFVSNETINFIKHFIKED